MHPVAGKETTGADAADPALFLNRRVILTPSAKSTPEAINKIEQLWRATGANVEMMDAATHDAILARSSHLPQVVSSALAAALNGEQIGDKVAAEYGAGGLRDTTRLAASSSEMWRDIFVTNREAIVAALKLYAGPSPNFSVQSKPATMEKRRPKIVQSRARRCGRMIRMSAQSVRLSRSTDPVGAGKSMAARELARALGFSYLNTGAMYRAVAIAARDAGISPDDPNVEERLAPVLKGIKIKFDGEKILLNGRDVTAKKDGPKSAISRRASPRSARCARGCASCSARRALTAGS